MVETENSEFLLNEEIIRREAAVQPIFDLGRKLYFENSILYLDVNLEERSLIGCIKDGNSLYTSEIQFDKEGNLQRYGCTCDIFKNYLVACPHIVAMMQAIYGNLKIIAYLTSERNTAKALNMKVPLNPVIVLNKVSFQDKPAQRPETVELSKRLPNSPKKTVELFKTLKDKYQIQTDYQKNTKHTDNIEELKQGKTLKQALKQVLKKSEAKPVFSLDSNAKEFFQAFNNFVSVKPVGKNKSTKKVKLIPTYYINNSYGGTTHWLEFTTGINKTYIVKNIVQYINCIAFRKPCKFGKSFNYDPETMEFEEGASKKMAELLTEICIDNKHLNSSDYIYYGTSYQSRRIVLSNSRLLEFLEIMKEHNQSFRLVIDELALDNMEIKTETPEIKMKLDRINGGFKLSFDILSDKIFMLDYEGRFIFYENSIYKLTPENAIIMSPIINYVNASRRPEVLIPDNEISNFYSNIAPHVENIGEIKIHKDIKTEFIREELSASIYFDRIKHKGKDGISARLEYAYGDITINPLMLQNELYLDDKIIIRNKHQENQIENLLINAGFSESRDVYCLMDEELMLDFITNELPVLKDMAEIYYSESFKTIKLSSNINFGAGVRLSTDGQWLEFTIKHDGIDSEELMELLSSYRLKKRYYKLNNGSFVILNDHQINTIADVIAKLELTNKDISKEIIQLPRYRAMYLDSLAGETEDFHIERSSQFKNLVQNIKEPGDMEFEVPASLKGILRDYQKTGFKWLKVLSEYGFGGILADDMGLGKTLQVITFLLYQKQESSEKPSIVIAPTSLVYNWEEEVKKFTKDLRVAVISGTVNERQQQLIEIKDADLVVTSYALIKRDIELYENIEFSHCFLDEAQYIKNPGTLNAQTVKRLKARNYFALTGTPIENSLTELWSIFDFLMPGYLFSHNKFNQIYETPIVKKNDSEALKGLARHISPFILRRMKKDVLKELPEKTEIRVSCTMEENQKKAYMAYLLKAKNIFEAEVNENGFEKSQIKILALLTRLRQICCHPSLFIENYNGGSGKVELFFDLINGAIEGGHRILVFSQFTSMLAIIKQELDAQKEGYFYLDGNTDPQLRIKMVSAFNKGENNLFLLSLKAGGTGLNLTGADTVIHLDPWWNPAVEDQATDRAYRIGQKNAVSVYKLVTKGTIEEKIYGLQERKKELINSIIKPGENFLTKMSFEEVKSLFETE
ncbi:MAG TPA: SNF2 helicase associated domain-containing protein [Clostridiales bacterium]|nr:SNF2 helicase associated domain-containing protein [Clostridiales bacterium]